MAISDQFPFDIYFLIFLNSIQTVVMGFHIFFISVMEVCSHFFEVPKIMVNDNKALQSHGELDDNYDVYTIEVSTYSLTWSCENIQAFLKDQHLIFHEAFCVFKLKLLWVSKEHRLQLKDFSISRLEIMVTEIISSNFEFIGNLIVNCH